MRAVVQRVKNGHVRVDDRTVGSVDLGVAVLVGISPDDGPEEARWLAEKIANLRIFNDEDGKMNLSLLDVGGAALVVSQFTLYGDARKGRRPSFVAAARGPEAERLYLRVIDEVQALGIKCEGGEFGANMDVHIVNAGPVTILLDSERRF